MRKSRKPQQKVTQKKVDADFISRISESGLPLFSLVENEFLISDKLKPQRPKAVLISIPRSGTHLGTELLKRLGLVYGGLHVSPGLEVDVVQDHRTMKLSPSGSLFWSSYRLPVTDIFHLIGNGQFVQGHVPFTDDIRRSLTGFKIVVIRRNLRDVSISSMRFISSLLARGIEFPDEYGSDWHSMADGPRKVIRYLETHGGGIKDMAKVIRPWETLPNSFCFDFEDLTNPHEGIAVSCIERVATFLRCPISRRRAQTIRKAIVGRPTATWTGKLSHWEDLWDEDVESAFRKFVDAPTAVEAHGAPPANFIEIVPSLQYVDPMQALCCATFAWVRNGDVFNQLVSLSHTVDRSNIQATILNDALFRKDSTHKVFPLSLESSLPEKSRIEAEDDWISISSDIGVTGHKHVTIFANIRPQSAVTLSLEVRSRVSGRYFMAQLGNDSGYFNCFVDHREQLITRIDSSDEWRAIYATVAPPQHGCTRVSLTGLTGSGADSYVRIYLCGDDGSLDFPGPANIDIRRLILSYHGVAL